MNLKVDDKVKFAEEKQCYTVKAANNKFAILTKPFNPKKTVLYTVIDYKRNIRGTENLIFGCGAETTKECKQMLLRLTRGITEVSYRNCIHLKIEKVNGVSTIINVNIDYAADDSCQIKLWAKGHHNLIEFLTACESELKAWDGRVIDLSKYLIKHTYYRTVKADKETKSYGVCDQIRIECKQAKGAYAVTELIDWLPLFTKD